MYSDILIYIFYKKNVCYRKKHGNFSRGLVKAWNGGGNYGPDKTRLEQLKTEHDLALRAWPTGDRWSGWFRISWKITVAAVAVHALGSFLQAWTIDAHITIRHLISPYIDRCQVQPPVG